MNIMTKEAKNMKWFYNLKIGLRITIGFLLATIVAGIIGSIGIFNLQRVNGSYKVAYTDSVTALEYVERISSSFQRIRMNLNGLVLAETPTDKKFYLEKIDEHKN